MNIHRDVLILVTTTNITLQCLILIIKLLILFIKFYLLNNFILSKYVSMFNYQEI